MNTRFSRTTLASAIALGALQMASTLAVAQDALGSSVEEVTIVGSLEEARKIAGSAHFIGEVSSGSSPILTYSESYAKCPA